MEKKPLSMKQKYRIFNISRIISYALLLFTLMMYGLQDPLSWISIALVVAVSVFRVMALRCPDCDELIPSTFGIMSKSCPKCGWNLKKEDKPQETPEA